RMSVVYPASDPASKLSVTTARPAGPRSTTAAAAGSDVGATVGAVVGWAVGAVVGASVGVSSGFEVGIGGEGSRVVDSVRGGFGVGEGVGVGDARMSAWVSAAAARAGNGAMDDHRAMGRGAGIALSAAQGQVGPGAPRV